MIVIKLLSIVCNNLSINRKLTQIRWNEGTSWYRRVIGRVRNRKLSRDSTAANHQISGRRGFGSGRVREHSSQYREYRCRGYIAAWIRHGGRWTIYDQTALMGPVRAIRVSVTHMQRIN